MTPARLHILSCGAPAESDKALRKFGDFLGLRTELLLLPDSPTEPPEPLLEPKPGGPILAFGRPALRQLMQHGWFERLLEKAPFVLAFGFSRSTGEAPELKWLTKGALSSMATTEAGPQRFKIHSDVRFASFPVSGKSFTLESDCSMAFFPAASGAGVETYISNNDKAVFVSVERGHTQAFLLADDELIDIDTPLEGPASSLRPWYSQLIAMSIFIRSASGPWCWTSPIKPATFVVDDPCLKPRYGFIDFETLLRELEKSRAALTVAYIPYNHRRSDPRTIDLLLRHLERFSIAVHGCDHTSGEFASLDEKWLAGTTSCALDRMEAHTCRTKMPFDKIVVFPQGRFSTKAIIALKAAGFHAAVNTSPWPEDDMENSLTIRDFLQLAVTRYENFPIFVRRYPRDIFDYAFDALFQKPLLGVEHHGFFRHGYESLIKLVSDLSSLDERLAWMPLGKTISSSCILKQSSEGRYTARHFSTKFRLKNSTHADMLLMLEKPEHDMPVDAVLVNGRQVPFEIHSGHLTYEARLGAGEELTASILYRQIPRTMRRASWKYHFEVFTRRVLSETRDNYLARSETALSMAEKIKKMLS